MNCCRVTTPAGFYFEVLDMHDDYRRFSEDVTQILRMIYVKYKHMGAPPVKIEFYEKEV